MTSFDGINIFRPWQFGFTKTEGDWFHVDQADAALMNQTHRNDTLILLKCSGRQGRGRQGLQAVQGFVSLTDQNEFTGGLYVVRGSHRNHSHVAARQDVCSKGHLTLRTQESLDPEGLAIPSSNFQRLLPPSLVESYDGASQEVCHGTCCTCCCQVL